MQLEQLIQCADAAEVGARLIVRDPTLHFYQNSVVPVNVTLLPKCPQSTPLNWKQPTLKRGPPSGPN